MEALPNPLRGEAAVTIGDVPLVIAVEFGGLTRLSKAIGAQSMEEIYRRLLGFEPFAVACALHCLVVHPEGAAKAMALGARAAEKLSAADEEAWRDAIEEALAGHIDKGKALRETGTLASRAQDAVRRANAEIAGDPDGGKAFRPS